MTGLAVVCILSGNCQAPALNKQQSTIFFRRKHTSYKDTIAPYGEHHALEIPQLGGLSETCPFLWNRSDPGQALCAGASKSSGFANRLVNFAFLKI